MHQAELGTDLDLGTSNCTDSCAYADKFKDYDHDHPSYNITLTGKYSVEYQQVMIKDICH